MKAKIDAITTEEIFAGEPTEGPWGRVYDFLTGQLHIYPARLNVKNLAHMRAGKQVFYPLPDECALCMNGWCVQRAVPEGKRHIVWHGLESN